jgi:hypothetical protein
MIESFLFWRGENAEKGAIRSGGWQASRAKQKGFLFLVLGFAAGARRSGELLMLLKKSPVTEGSREPSRVRWGSTGAERGFAK